MTHDIDGEVLYIRDLARALGRSEFAIAAALRRRSPTVPHEHVFLLGRRIAVRKDSFYAWLQKKDAACRSGA